MNYLNYIHKYQEGTGEKGIQPRFETRNGIIYMITEDNPAGQVVGEVPVSGTDPVGELVVEGAVLGKPFELGLKGLGLLGKAGWKGLSKVAPKATAAVETGINSTKTAIKKLNPKNYFSKSEPLSEKEIGLQNFIDNDIIPRAKTAGHDISTKYKPTIRTMDPANDLLDAKMQHQGAGAWFTPATNDVTLRGSIENNDFGVLAHEAGGHGFRYNLQSDYKPTTRKFLNEFIENGSKADPNSALGKELSKTHLGTQSYTTKEISALEEAYPWVNNYKTTQTGFEPLHEQGAINTQFRAKLSENGKIIGKELDKKIDELNDYDLFNFLKDQPYTSSIVDDIAVKTGTDADDIIFISRTEFSDLISKFPQIKDQLNKVKYAMKYVGGAAVPITISAESRKKLGGKLNYLNYINNVGRTI